MFKWIVSDTVQYLEPFNFVDLCSILFFVIELFDHLTVCIYKMCLKIMYLIYMYKQDLALNNQQCLIYHKTKPN